MGCESRCNIYGMTKAINVTIDERLLEQLDNRPEVRSRGRSAVVREALADYLNRRETEDHREETEEEIARAYERAYGPGMPPDELEDWTAEAAWA